MDNRKRVLVVDDEDDVAIFMSCFLSRFGIENDVAKDGESALKFLNNNPYNCVFLDLNLGSGINGFDILKRIKADKPKMKVVVISGSVDNSAIGETMNMGADHFLVKPIDLLELKKTMEQYLQ